VREVKLILEKHRPSKTQYPSAWPEQGAAPVRLLTPQPVGKLGNYVVRVRLIAEEARLMTLVRPASCRLEAAAC